ncbi:hypothetical protein ACIA03_22180 [Nocardioides sp. NPDC051685]|uniref:hypothetical protein n=1 Tax=Nocardioides sp. NPDC051685 TaxID=3364334 RepID=UPI00379DB296
MPRTTALGRFGSTIAVTFALVLALTACGSTDEGTVPSAEPIDATSSVIPSGAASSAAPVSPTADSTDLGPLLTVTIDGEEVSPNAEEIDLGTGEKLLVEIDSDRAGELHVHSAPEQLIEYAEGTTNGEIVVNTPGTVEVEDHDTGAVVALIEVR